MIRRRTVRIDGRWGPRQVHFRSAGNGAPLLLLHQSPQSSLDLQPTIEAWAGRALCLAPDMPGYGLSQPISEEPSSDITMEDLADATVEFLDAIDVEQVGIYGFHSGAMLAVMIALRHPSRVAAVAANGYVMLEAGDRADILDRYLPPFTPSWDGSHLTWLWARFREQTVFFPWFRHTPSARLLSDMPQPSATHQRVLDVLRAGAWYGSAYRAAFAMDGSAALDELTVPTLITASRNDVLAPALAGLITAPPIETRVIATASETMDASIDFLLERVHLGTATATTTTATTTTAPSLASLSATAPIDFDAFSRRAQPTRTPTFADLFVAIGDRNVRVRVSVNDASQSAGNGWAEPAGPVIIVADIGASARQGDDLLGALARHGIGAIAIEHPGHGETEARASYGPDWLDETLDALRVPGHTIVAFGIAAAAALRRRPGSTKRVFIVDLGAGVDPGERSLGQDVVQFAPTIDATYSGGHLLDVWHAVRLGRLFRPWYSTVSAAARPGTPDLEPASIHREVVDLLHSGGSAAGFRREAGTTDISALAADARRCGVLVTFVDDPVDSGELAAVLSVAVLGTSVA